MRVRAGPRPAAKLTAALLIVAGCGGSPDAGICVGTLERDRVELSAEVAEPIVAVNVDVGDAVSEGQIIVALDPRRADARLERATAALEQARAALAERVRGPRTELIAAARARLAGAESAARAAGAELARARQLAQSSIASQSRLDLLQADYDTAVARRDEAREALAMLLDGTTAEELAQAEAAVAQASGEVDELTLARARLDVRAPGAGRIDALPFEVGERAPAGAPLAVLLTDTAPYARVYLPQPLRVRVAPGARAVIRVPGAGLEVGGRLRSVSHDAAFTPYFALTQHDRSRLSYLAEVELDGPQARDLPTGVPVEVEFVAVGAAAP